MNIWTNGCFDILHTGHIELLWYAKLFNPELLLFPKPVYTNKLFVGLDSDERVKRLKGQNRPINDINTRLTIMQNLKMVDDTVVFNSDDELRNYIKVFNIDYVIVGDHYRNKEVIGAENAKYGAAFYQTDDRSTTNIINKIKKIIGNEEITVAKFEISYNNEIIKMSALPYDIMTNRMMFGEHFLKSKFYELEILEYIKSRYMGGVALDIGANIGNHSIYFSKFIFDKTLAFEADSKSFTILSENKKMNNIDDDKLVAYNVALSDGHYKYQIITEDSSNRGGSKVVEGNGELMTKKLDDFDLPKVDFIKIDVEGHELKVLKGAVNLINRDFPDIIVECMRENTYPDCQTVDSYMEQLNYRLIESFLGYGMYYYKHKL